LIVYRLHGATRAGRSSTTSTKITDETRRALPCYIAATVLLCCLEVLVHPILTQLPAEPDVFEGMWDIGSVEQTCRLARAGSTVLRSLAIKVRSV